LHTGGEYTGRFSAEVVWTDAAVIDGTPSVIGAGRNTKVTVKTKSGVSGNAVVKIYKAGDTAKTPVWSWHIWVTDYTGAATWTNPNQTAFIFMNRNLGATAATLSLAGRGLLYQWGRKDPFPGGASGIAGYAARSSFKGMPDAGSTATVTVSSSDVAGAIVESVRNPTTFYIQKANSDWLPKIDNNLWNTTSSQKTIYDPCPSGWRVPARVNNDSPWKGLSGKSYSTGNAAGANWGANALFPAAGCRNNTNGKTAGAGENGYLWSASPSSSGSTASNIYFYNNAGINVNDNTYRARGFSIRCVKE
jgi:hypothetical protein